MVIHIMPDDKYVDTFVRDVLSIDDRAHHRFLVRAHEPYKYIDKSLGYEPVNVGSAEFRAMMEALANNDLIVIHFLTAGLITWLAEANLKAHIGWAFWGSDFYENCHPALALYDPLTEQYRESIKPRLSRFAPLHYWRARKQRLHQEGVVTQRRKVVAAALGKLHYIYHFMKNDYDIIQHFYPGKAKFSYFHYRQPQAFTEIEAIAEASEEPVFMRGFDKKIWVGNCGYAPVNHLDAFQLLKDISNDTAVVVPLNYGNAEYIAHIIATGKRMFGDRFVPVTDYLPFKEFVACLKHVDVSIMPHNTPWAVGNIAMLVAFGKKVYLKNHLASYHWFTQGGVRVEDYGTFSLSNCFVPPSSEEVQKALDFCHLHLSSDAPFDVINDMIKDHNH